jgi:hypothetical protein
MYCSKSCGKTCHPSSCHQGHVVRLLFSSNPYFTYYWSQSTRIVISEVGNWTLLTISFKVFSLNEKLKVLALIEIENIYMLSLLRSMLR